MTSMASKRAQRTKEHQRTLFPRVLRGDQDVPYTNLRASFDLQQPAMQRNSKRRRLACKACRQAKSRCEGTVGGVARCKRCSDLSCECVVDTAFKRINQRTEIRDLQHQVQQLRWQAQSTPPAIGATAPSDPSSSTSNMPPNSSPSSQRHVLEATYVPQSSLSLEGSIQHSDAPSATHLHNPDLINLSIVPVTVTRTLENLTIDAIRIVHLFNLYFHHYHSFFPILRTAKSPDRVYESSPLLFWTVVITAARHDRDNPSLIASAVEPVKRLLWTTVSAPPYSVHTLHAIGLLCVWHLPASSMSTNVSFMLAGLLRTGAMHIGLHRPEILQDFSRVKCELNPQELHEVVKTWCACYLAAEDVTTSIGQASIFGSDDTIERASSFTNPYSLPTDLHDILVIQRFVHRIHQAMDGIDKPNSGCSSLMPLLLHDLKNLESYMDRQKSLEASLMLVAAKLQLETYYLFDESDSDDRRLGVINAYNTAIKFISMVDSANKSTNLAHYFPSSLMMTCHVAAIVVMKVAHSSYSQFVDLDRGKQGFNTIVLLDRHCSVQDNDLMGRMSRILSQLWNVHQALAREQVQRPRLKIKSRSIASIIHDSAWLWRENFGGLPDNGAPSLQPSVRASLDTAQHPGTSDHPTPPSNVPDEIASMATGTSAGPQTKILRQSTLQDGVDAIGATDVDFTIDTLPDFQEENDWMWNVGFPSLSGMDLDSFP